MSEVIKQSMVIPKRTRERKYQYLLDLKPRDEITLEGETVVFDNTKKNYMLICSGVVPRYNKEFAPKKWEFAISRDKKTIYVQRVS